MVLSGFVSVLVFGGMGFLGGFWPFGVNNNFLQKSGILMGLKYEHAPFVILPTWQSAVYNF